MKEIKYVMLSYVRFKVTRMIDAHAWIQRGTGDLDPSCKSQILGVLRNFVWKIIGICSEHSIPSHRRPASETPFKMRFAGGPIMADFRLYTGLEIN